VEGLALAATDGTGGFTASRRHEVVGNPIGEHTGDPWLQFGGLGTRGLSGRGFHGGAAWLAGIDGEGPGKGSLARLAGSVSNSELR
jgi:hypothetical protein